MQVKRFVAENMRMALNMVREEMGDDAVILSNKRVEGGIEILTALDPEGQLTGGNLQESPRSENSSANVPANPFQQDDRIAERHPQSSQTSKLEIELERMQRDSKERARQLAAMLNEKSPTPSSQSTASKTPAAVPKRADGKVTKFKDVMAASFDKSESQSPVMDTEQLEADVVSVGQAVASKLKSEKNPDQESTSNQHFEKFTDDAGDVELSQMRSEIQSMRDMMEQQLSSMAWGQFRAKSPQKASLWRRLKRMGIEAEISNNILVDCDSIDGNKSVWQAVMASLSHTLPTQGDDLITKGGVFAFVGPTGAGKTTTIGKLAARYVLENGPSDIALISTDTARIAAYEQLRTFGRILNVPVKVVDEKNTLDRVLYSLRDKSLVLVDTGGLNRLDPRLQYQLESINKLGSRIKGVLVLPATSQGAVLKAVYDTYKTDNLISCVVTKLDEAMSLGEVISLAVLKKLPIAYSTDGQAVPADIAVASGRNLISLAIKMAQTVEVDSEAMMTELASISK